MVVNSPSVRSGLGRSRGAPRPSASPSYIDVGGRGLGSPKRGINSNVNRKPSNSPASRRSRGAVTRALRSGRITPAGILAGVIAGVVGSQIIRAQRPDPRVTLLPNGNLEVPGVVYAETDPLYDNPFQGPTSPTQRDEVFSNLTEAGIEQIWWGEQFPWGSSQTLVEWGFTEIFPGDDPLEIPTIPTFIPTPPPVGSPQPDLKPLLPIYNEPLYPEEIPGMYPNTGPRSRPKRNPDQRNQRNPVGRPNLAIDIYPNGKVTTSLNQNSRARNKREVKSRSPVFMVLMTMLDLGSEMADMLKILFENSGINPNIPLLRQAEMFAFEGHAAALDWPQFLVDLGYNHIEDKIIGRANAAVDKPTGLGLATGGVPF